MQARNWKANWNFSPVSSRTALLPWHWTRSMMLQCKLYAWSSASSSEYSDVTLHTVLGFCFYGTTQTFAIDVGWGVTCEGLQADIHECKSLKPTILSLCSKSELLVVTNMTARWQWEVHMLHLALQSRPLPKRILHCWYRAHSVNLWMFENGSVKWLSFETVARDWSCFFYFEYSTYLLH